MKRVIRACALLAALLAPRDASPAEPAQPPAATAPPRETWFPTSTPGLRVALVSGRPDQRGPYTLAFEMEPGARLLPRRYPDARTLTVVSGRLLVGRGERFDAKGLTSLPAGASTTIEAGAPYYLTSPEKTAFRASGTGPSSGARVGTDPPVGGATPASTWLALRGAYGSGDFRTFATLVVPASHAELLCEPCFLLLFAAVDGGPIGEKEGREIESIARRHGANIRGEPGGPTPCGRAFAEAVGDKVGLFADLMDYFRARRIGPAVPAHLMRDLSDLAETGATATARDGVGRPVAFDRTAEGWFVRWPRPSCLDAWDADLGRPPTPGTSR